MSSSPQPQPAEPSTSTSFESMAAGVPDVIGGPAVVASEPIPAESNAERLAKTITPAAVSHWIEWVGKAVAKMLQSEDYNVTEFEKTLFSEPLAIICEKHLPELLKKTDSPEWAMLGTAVTLYAGRVALIYQMRKLELAKKETEDKKPWGQNETPEPVAQAKTWGRSSTAPAL